jgi:hypothetical protein
MADTSRGDYSEKFCAHCGKQGCYIKHWGPLMKGRVVYFDECIAGPLRAVDGNGIDQTYNCDTGELLNQ